MPDIALISQAIEYIEENLREPLGVADMANAVSYSLFHFSRVFNESTHHTPYDYVIRRRLSEAAKELARTDRKIVEIAFDYQFKSHETFTRAFKRMFGQQPSESRRDNPIHRQLMPRLTAEHLQQIAKGQYLRPVLRDFNAFKLMGVMTLVQDDAGTVADLWRLFRRQLTSLGPVARRCRFFGVTYCAGSGAGSEFLHMAGIRSEDLVCRHEAWVEKTVPPLRCATFVHKGPLRDKHLTLDYIFHTWLPKSGERLSRPWVIEQYGINLARLEDPDAEVPISIPIQPVMS